MNEDILVERLKARDEQAFKAFVEKYQNKVFRLIMGFVHDTYAAQDIAQDVFVKLWEKIPEWKAGKAKISTWLYKVAVNHALNYIKREDKKEYVSDLSAFTRVNDDGSVEIQIEDTLRNPHDSLENKELAQILRKAIKALPKKQRIAFVLSKYQNMSSKEIAEVMEISPGNVDVILHRAKKNLQKNILKLMQ